MLLPGSAGARRRHRRPTTADGVSGSLRDAFDTANTDGEDTQITLAAGAEYVLDVCTDDDTERGWRPGSHLADALTIVGNGATIRQTCDGAARDRQRHDRGRSRWRTWWSPGEPRKPTGVAWRPSPGAMSPSRT
ncbi:MAG: hypothetical protein U5R31_11775 [Acidimicrobiia bacterium]|nr:hypothetical protein [Acidimicrobiia bacterium]